jgi:spore coat polysaccharide biosynthesis protein SpsF
VLERFYQAAKQYNADIVIRVTADDPLIDPTVLSEMLAYFIEHITANKKIDYLSNSFGKRTYPLGLDLEIFTKAALEQAYKNASQDYQREHVTPYIYQNSNEFSVHGFYNDEDLSKYRLTLDTPEDFQVISSIYKNLFVEGEIFGMQNVISFLRHNPDLVLINEHVIQKSI